MGTNCAPLVADLFLICYERDFMLSLSDNNQTNIVTCRPFVPGKKALFNVKKVLAKLRSKESDR